MSPATLPTRPPVPATFSAVSAAALQSDHYEVIAGEYRELPPMGARQSMIANLLAQFLADWARPRRAGHVAVEVLFQLDPAGPLQRRPDVAFVNAERWSFERSIPDENAWAVAPNLAVEVVSPTNTVDEIMDKIEDYFDHGVERVWIVLPKQRAIQVYSSTTSIRAFALADIVRDEDAFPGFELPVASLFPAYLT